MNQGREGSVSESVRKVAPLSEVAGRFGISRPTLYRYMDLYDDGEADRIPRELALFLDEVTSGRASADESRVRLIQGTYNIEDDLVTEEVELDVWSPGQLPAMSVGDRGRGMVIFRDAFEEPDWTRVVVSVRAGGVEADIGTYVPERGRRYVTIDDLVPKLDYFYRVEQGRGPETAESETMELELRRSDEGR